MVGEPCNVDAHANFPDLLMTNVCPWLCVHMYCTLYSCLVDQSEHHIHDTHKKQDTDKVKC